MITLALGTHGEQVCQIERRLQELNLYAGPIDGAFGGGVQSGVKALQRSHGLTPDGIVGPATWAALFPGKQPPDEIELTKQPLTQRCLVRKLTIANGQGTVHNVPYDLEHQFGIRLVNFAQ